MRGQKVSTTANDIIKAELAATRQELVKKSGFLKGLYESLIDGDITKTEYAEMKENYETRIAALTERENRLTDKIRERSLRESALEKAGESLDNVSVINDITAEVLDTLVEKILLFEDKHIEVTFKFSGETMKTEMNGRFIWRRNRPKKKKTEGGANEYIYYR